MTVLRGVISEVVHLFVDNGSLALALILWCGAVRLTIALLPQLLAALGPIFFVGCAVVLLVNIIRTARPRAAKETS
jgi:4-hydroxybenzoate polyprenyltransferase